MLQVAPITLPEADALPGEIALSVQNLSAGYAGMRPAVEQVSFNVLVGERVAVIGPNGAGKSTLFKAIVGLLPFNSGSISIHGQDCRTSHNLVGYVPQHEAVDWSFPATVYDAVMMGRTRKIRRILGPSRDDHQGVQEALSKVGLMPFRNRQIGQLSGGQKRRVFIARALAQETNVLLLDEPFSGVDAAAEHEIMETLDLLQAAGITMLLATHDLNMAATRFDRLLLLRRHVVAYGMPEAVFQPDLLQEAYGGRIGVFQQGTQTVVIADEHGCP
ncbi:MAG: metal ABC transporter ATP-binding protein [bacterium]|nr:metal ABC transporter ATP-binding protein [bacterium]